MPTGYTAQLTDIKYDTKKWLTTILPRAFGICVMLRDEKNGLSAEEIIEKLQVDTYYADELIKAEKDLKILKKKSNKKWASDLKIYKKAEGKMLKEGIKECKLTQKKFDKVKGECEKLLTKAKDEVATGILKFAVHQITDTVKWDCDTTYYVKSLKCIEKLTVADFNMLSEKNLSSVLKKHGKKVMGAMYNERYER